jgi:hypothetical protein
MSGYCISFKLYQLSTSAPYNNVININMKMKMTASIIHNIFDKQKWWGKRGMKNVNVYSNVFLHEWLLY